MADATYLQPFDDLKLPLNVIASWVILAQTPDLWFWPGALLIVGASLFIMRQDSGRTVRAYNRTAMSVGSLTGTIGPGCIAT